MVLFRAYCCGVDLPARCGREAIANTVTSGALDAT